MEIIGNLFDTGKEIFKIDKPIRLIELFAGIGSQAKALENLGVDFQHWRICEFDKYAVKSYNAVHGTEFSTSDITKITAEDLAIKDTDKYCYILTYSFPCTDLSVAGKMLGMAEGSGTRSSLLWQVQRLLNECDELPQVLLLENVPQVHSEQNMPHFRRFLSYLENLGYCNYWDDLNAKHYGVAQNRNRTFCVSLLGNYTYHFPKPIGCKLTVRDYLEYEVDEKHYLTSDKAKELIDKLVVDGKIKGEIKTGVDFSYSQAELVNDSVSCIKARYDGGINLPKYERTGVVESKSICVINPEDDGSSRTIKAQYQQSGPANFIKTNSFGATGVVEVNVLGQMDNTKDNTHESANRVYSPDGLCPTIPTMAGGGHEPKFVHIRQATEEGVVPCLIGGVADLNYTGSQTRRGRVQDNGLTCPALATINQPSVIEKWLWMIDGEWYRIRIRKLIPLECWLLMGFDRESFFRAEKVNSNAQLYKQAGNSIVVDVLEDIFKQMIEGK